MYNSRAVSYTHLDVYKRQDYDATGTFEATEVIVSAEVAGKLLNLDIEEGKRLQTGEEIGLVDTLQLYLKKLQLEANMKSVESQRPDLAKQIAATKQQIATAERDVYKRQLFFQFRQSVNIRI